jgi:N-dimethylarginine dimethylaminohydrolase
MRMEQEDSELPISERRLEKVRRYIAERVPLVPKDNSITVDEKSLDGLLPEALDATPTFMERLKRAWDWMRGRAKKKLLTPQKAKQLRKILMDDFNRAAESLPFEAAELDREAPSIKRKLIMAGPEELTFGDDPEGKTQIFREWFCIRHALLKAGAHLEIIPPSNRGGIREVYTRDRYVMIGGTAYLPDAQKLQDLNDAGDLSTPADDIESYKGEIAQIQKELNSRGVTTVIVKDAWFEGGNVVRHASSRTIFVGIDDPWSSEASAQNLVDAINKTQPHNWSMVPVPLTNMPDMYHLDTGMSEELPHGEVMISPRVTNKQTFNKIAGIVGRDNIIRLSNGDAENLATNMIDVGDTLILTGNCKKLRRKLAGRGYKVILPADYGQDNFEFGLGGVHCMTNDIEQPRRRQALKPG